MLNSHALVDGRTHYAANRANREKRSASSEKTSAISQQNERHQRIKRPNARRRRARTRYTAMQNDVQKKKRRGPWDSNPALAHAHLTT